jgi:endonuclease G
MKKAFRTLAIALGLTLSFTAHAGFLADIVSKEAVKGISGSVKTADAAVDLPDAKLGFAPCKDLFPGGRPLDAQSVNAQWQVKPLCANNFATLYSALSKTPLVVVERLNKSQLKDALDEERTDNFFADPRLASTQRAELKDFVGSGHDRGHMAAAANQPDAIGMAQSFVLTNMIPQNPTNNRKIWSKLESDTRKFARRANGNVFVFSGPIFDNGHATIGKNKVWVPTRLFKLVYDEASGRAWAHILDNTATAVIGEPVSYPEFVKLTGWQVLPGNLQ